MYLEKAIIAASLQRLHFPCILIQITLSHVAGSACRVSDVRTAPGPVDRVGRMDADAEFSPGLSPVSALDNTVNFSTIMQAFDNFPAQSHTSLHWGQWAGVLQTSLPT